MRKIFKCVIILMVLYSSYTAISSEYYIKYTDLVTKYYTQYKKDRSDAAVSEIYNKILAASGQSQNALPLIIVDSNESNAMNDGRAVYINRGLIDSAESWDIVALVLGHEVAHGMLGHLGELNTNDPTKVQVLEGNADKLGAIYMMKAGFDICKGRELFNTWKKQHGNALATSHPAYSYRYDELNIGCN